MQALKSIWWTLVLLAAWPVQAADRHWTGPAGGAWSVAGHWSEGVAPVAGDLLFFQGGAHARNDMPDVVFGGLVFEGSGLARIEGDVRVETGITARSFVDVQFLGASSTVSLHAPVAGVLGTFGDLRFEGRLVGSGEIFFDAAGDATFHIAGGIHETVPTRVKLFINPTVTIEGSSSFTGELTSNGGWLHVRDLGAPGAGARMFQGRLRYGFCCEPIAAPNDILEPVHLNTALLMFEPTGRPELQTRVQGPIDIFDFATILPPDLDPDASSEGDVHLDGAITGGGLRIGTAFGARRGRIVLSNPANAFTGGLEVLGPVAVRLGRSEVIPNAGRVLLSGGRLELRDTTETIAALECEGGLLDMHAGRGWLATLSPPRLRSCALAVTLSAQASVRCAAEIPLVRNLSGIPVDGAFANAAEGALFSLGGTRMSLTYRGGASGHDITLVREDPFDCPPTDFEGNGMADLVWQHADGSVAMWLMDGTRQTGGGRLVGPGTGWAPAFVADFDGDRHADLLWRRADGSVAIWLMRGATQVGGGALLGAGSGWSPTHVADLDGDGRADILWAHEDGRAAAWLMHGARQIGGGALVAGGTGWSVSHAGDFDGDGKADLAWRRTDGRSALWLMDGARMRSAWPLLPAGTGWSIQALGDFDANGKADIVWRRDDGRAALWLMDGGRQVGGNALIAASTGWSLAHLGDFDGDRKADILWQHADGRAALWRMDGAFMASAAPLRGAGTGWSAARVADHDGDRRDDIAWVGNDGAVELWLMNGATARASAGLLPGATGWSLAP